MEDSKEVLNEAEPKLNEQRGNEQVDQVSYDTHKRTLAQRAKLKEERDLMAAELEKFKSAERQREENKLKEQGEYKKLLEAKEERIKQLESATTDYERRFVDAHKLNAFKEHLGADLKKPEYYDYVALENIAIDPETGIVDTDSLKPVVEAFTMQYEELINRAAKSKQLPNQAPPTEHRPKGLADMTLEEKLKLLGKSLA